ncbi:Carbamoyl-phosphate synthase small chain [Phycisphaerae bacterium RAS1]|nr:Carbamoyl-phosphate synthase small chain [Phycisphaerae bacterium RAS1]
MSQAARLVLADGSVFHGQAFGAAATRGGEVVFNTAHSGYQEIITDPSYCGQIVCMTAVQQGNYGVNDEDDESDRPLIEGFAIRELSPVASNYRSRRTLDAWLKACGIPGISGVNTRELTLRLRVEGAINGVISTRDESDETLLEMARGLPSMAGLDLVRRVATGKTVAWERGFEGDLAPAAPPRPIDRHVVAIDCGMKRNILRNLVHIGCRVTVVPPTTPAEAIREMKPDGVFLSNGPGDPQPVTYVQETIRDLSRDTPIFGICLGHQLLALALGAETYKLRFGHHGCNHPVRNMRTGRVEITSQNHGFAVSPQSMARVGLELTHQNLYDQTVEGFRHRELPLFAVQYHPEAAPGPHDAAYLFGEFREMMGGDELRVASSE